MPRCKAPEILRSETYMKVRRNDEGRGQRRRWAFFSTLLGVQVQDIQEHALELTEVLGPLARFR